MLVWFVFLLCLNSFLKPIVIVTKTEKTKAKVKYVLGFFVDSFFENNIIYVSYIITQL